MFNEKVTAFYNKNKEIIVNLGIVLVLAIAPIYKFVNLYKVMSENAAKDEITANVWIPEKGEIISSESWEEIAKRHDEQNNFWERTSFDNYQKKMAGYEQKVVLIGSSVLYAVVQDKTIIHCTVRTDLPYRISNVHRKDGNTIAGKVTIDWVDYVTLAIASFLWGGIVDTLLMFVAFGIIGLYNLILPKNH